MKHFYRESISNIVNQLESGKRRQGKNYFHKAAKGRHSRKPTPTDDNTVKRIFDRRTYSLFKLIAYKITVK